VTKRFGRVGWFDWVTVAISGFSSLTVFSIITNISGFLQQNWGFPREGLGGLYLAGGIASFLILPWGGRLVDSTSCTRGILISSFVVMAALVFGFYDWRFWFAPPWMVFVLLMSGMSLWNVAFQSILSRVPAPQDRSGYMSLLSASQHAGMSVGAWGGSLVLVETSEGRLEGMTILASVAILTAALLPGIVRWIENRIHLLEERRSHSS
jgi:predicted MFS family arabinose efflux permease